MSDIDAEPRSRSATGAVIIAVIFLAVLGTGVGIVLGTQRRTGPAATTSPATLDLGQPVADGHRDGRPPTRHRRRHAGGTKTGARRTPSRTADDPRTTARSRPTRRAGTALIGDAVHQDRPRPRCGSASGGGRDWSTRATCSARPFTAATSRLDAVHRRRSTDEAGVYGADQRRHHATSSARTGCGSPKNGVEIVERAGGRTPTGRGDLGNRRAAWKNSGRPVAVLEANSESNLRRSAAPWPSSSTRSRRRARRTATRSCSTTSRCASCPAPRSAWSARTAPASPACCGSWRARTSRATARPGSCPATPSACSPRSRQLNESQDRARQHRGGRRRDQGASWPGSTRSPS